MTGNTTIEYIKEQENAKRKKYIYHLALDALRLSPDLFVLDFTSKFPFLMLIFISFLMRYMLWSTVTCLPFSLSDLGNFDQ